MPIEITDRTDLRRFADEPCHPYVSAENPTFDPPEGWSSLDDEMDDAPFALNFDSGGEG